jgi:hypothetical protein
MLFRDENGNLMEINKHDYVSDTLYYQKILKIKMQFAKSKNEKNQNILKKTFHNKQN